MCSNEESSALLHFKHPLSDSYSSLYCDDSYPKMKHWKVGIDCYSWDGVICDRVMGHVIRLDLSCSRLQGNIPSNTSLFLLSHLQMLNLAFNDFNLSQIPFDFVRFPSLAHLDLSFSNISGQVPLEISYLSKLISLDLSINDLTLETLVIEGLVQNMSHLQKLSLVGVNMSTVALGTLTNINLPSLKSLKLVECELQGTLLSGLFNLPSLETISLHGNQLSGPIPSSIFELVNLRTLFLSSNHLSGTVELYMFAKLKNLGRLVLSYNSLSINTTFKVNSSFPQLYELGLSSCYINEFPKILSTTDNLEYLDLSDNKIHGRIPNWLPSLMIIYLGGNQLSGTIPSSIFEMVNLVHLDLSSNHLSGTIKLYMFAKLKIFGSLIFLITVCR